MSMTVDLVLTMDDLAVIIFHYIPKDNIGCRTPVIGCRFAELRSPIADRRSPADSRRHRSPVAVGSLARLLVRSFAHCSLARCSLLVASYWLVAV